MVDISLSNIQQTTRPFDYTTFVQEVLTVHGNELWLFMDQGIPPTIFINVAHLT